jgi:two-component system nitrogen regulation sensor histidine kinase NtrY
VRRRLAFAAAGLSFVVFLALFIWQGSFHISYSPSGPGETIVLWAVSTLIFLLTVTLGFMLFRAGVKHYIDRQRNKEGSRIRSKLLFGALILALAPALFFVLFSGWVLNRHLESWFIRPPKNIEAVFQQMDASYRREAQARISADANWISLLPEIEEAARQGHVETQFFRAICKEHRIHELIFKPESGVPILLYQVFEKPKGTLLNATVDVSRAGEKLGTITVYAAASDGLPPSESQGSAKSTIESFINAQSGRLRFYQDTYFRLICLITVFVLFFASWCAQVVSRQISVPISALLGAAQEVRRGNLSYRVRVNAIDELATLVRAFNEMTNELEGNAKELEARRRFIEAILESIPTGVISVSADERIELVNRALSGIFPYSIVTSAKRLQDVFQNEDLAEIRYMLKRARRTGAAACQIDLGRPSGVMHLAVIAASLEEQRGFVIVLEDTSDLLRAQKAIAWQEVARRIAHEIKNPLTPISLSADRISRQLLKVSLPSEVRIILEECTQTIQQEVQTVKSLVDEFAQFSRFPSAQPAPADLNEIVESAMAVFNGRLEGFEADVKLGRGLPQVMADREQMKRVIVNLIDNAAEAMTDSPLRKLLVRTAWTSPETVELSVTDTGPGVSAADKERLFLPYFSTKERGTGLGLAIVSRIVSEHHGRVRVEDNQPTGASFIVELSVIPPVEASSAESAEKNAATLKL